MISKRIAVASALGNAEAIKEQLPGRDRSERQCGGVRVIERGGLMTGDALVDDAVLGIGAGAGDGAGVKHGVAGLEQRDGRADGLDRPDGIPTEQARRVAEQPARTLVSTGFTAMARIFTSRSCGPGSGFGNSVS